MSKISEQKALEEYPLPKEESCSTAFINQETFNSAKRTGYEKGYDQAMQDFMEKACKFLDDRIVIYQEIEVNENREPLADSYIAYCVARKQEAERVINSFKNYMKNESEK